MSWQAIRFQKRTIKTGKGTRLQRIERRPYQIFPQDDLIAIFDHPSASHALEVCIRLQRMKRRSERPLLESRGFKKKRFHNRNYHHLTPKSRPGEPYYGNGRQNMCLIRVQRHNAWHDIFGLQTLEETIEMLLRCVTVRQQVYLIFQCIAAVRRSEKMARAEVQKAKKWRRRFISA